MEFKDIIKIRRSALGLTLDDIARYVGVSGATVSRWESGDIENIRRDKIAKLAEVLQVTPAYLMGWENTSEEQDFGLTAIDIAERLNAPKDLVMAVLSDMNWPDTTNPEILSKISAEIERRKMPAIQTDSGQIQLNGTYLRLAQGAQELGLDDEDVDAILAIYTKHKQKNQ